MTSSDRAVADGLCAAIPEAVGCAPGRWQWRLPHDVCPLTVQATLTDSWLTFVGTPCGPVTAPRGGWWSLLERSAGLSGPVRAAVAPGAATWHLRADVCVDEPAALVQAVGEVAASLPEAIAALSIDGSPTAPLGFSGALDSSDVESVATRCAEAGWDGNRRSSGDVLVSIACPHATLHARLIASRTGHAGLAVDVAEVGSPLSRQAVALFLLQAAAVVRGVRAIGRAAEGAASAGLAVDVRTPATADALTPALSALTVAVRLVHREAPALTDERVARLYLATRGVPIGTTDDSREAHDDRSPTPAQASLHEEVATCQ
jgi:hypothetical protein